MPESQHGNDEYDLGAAGAWLIDQQLADGSFPGSSGASDVETTIDAVMLQTRVSARMGPAHDYLLQHGPAYGAKGPGESARLMLAGIVLHEYPFAFGGRGGPTAISDPPCDEFQSGGVNLMSPIDAWFAAHAPESVPYGTNLDEAEVERAVAAGQKPGAIPRLVGRDLHDHAYVLLALSAYGMLDEEFPDSAAAIAPFVSTQATNGGWAVDGAADPDAVDAHTTSLVVQALVDWEWMDSPMLQRGIAFLRSMQTPDGGVAFTPKEPRVADSAATGLAMQALLATREEGMAPHVSEMRQALVRFQHPSGGFRRFMDDNEPDLPATLQAMLPLSNRYLPVRYFCSSQ